jgi:hypothetical protein
LTALTLLTLLAPLPACTSNGPRDDEPTVVPAARPLPAYADIAAAQNARAAMLDRFWAATTAIVTYQDQDGQVRTEQAEGHVQIIQPHQVALSLGKQITSEIYFYLGSNEEFYWWLDRLDPERGVAYVGTHAMATPERAARFGAPVHPLDLLDLLGITPLPEAGAEGSDPATPGGTGGNVASVATVEGVPTGDPPGLPPGVRVAWSPDGSLVMVDVPGRFGTRRVSFEPDTLLPRRVEILDQRGRVAVYSTLAGDVVAEVLEDSRQRPLVSAQVEVLIPGSETSIRLRMDRIENRGSRQRDNPFNLEGVLRAYPVDRIEDLDALEIDEPAPSEARPPAPVRTPDRRLRTSPGAGAR